jgi:hypothetical protein
MAKVTIKYSETTREQRRAIFQQMWRDLSPAESLELMIGRMRELEDRYGMSTVEFFARFVEGKMGDHKDFIIWAGTFRAYQELLRKHFDLDAKVQAA